MSQRISPTQDCLICLEPCSQQQSCTHFTHKKCLERWWYDENTRIDNQGTCPLCKQKVLSPKLGKWKSIFGAVELLVCLLIGMMDFGLTVSPTCDSFKDSNLYLALSISAILILSSTIGFFACYKLSTLTSIIMLAIPFVFTLMYPIVLLYMDTSVLDGCTTSLRLLVLFRLYFHYAWLLFNLLFAFGVMCYSIIVNLL